MSSHDSTHSRWQNLHCGKQSYVSDISGPLSCFNHTGYGTLSLGFCKAFPHPVTHTSSDTHIAWTTLSSHSIYWHGLLSEPTLYEIAIPATLLRLHSWHHHRHISEFYDGLSSLPEGRLPWAGTVWPVPHQSLGSYFAAWEVRSLVRKCWGIPMNRWLTTWWARQFNEWP